MPGKFEIKRAKDNEFYFNLLAPNGEIILTSDVQIEDRCQEWNSGCPDKRRRT